jgi:membrane carboxypeptidase/penicillin-binding protein
MKIWTAATRLLAKSMFRHDFATVQNKIDLFSLGNYKSQIPSAAVQLLIAGEDRRFMSHPGVDVIGIVRAVRNYLVYGRVEGASTIEQQLVRVLTERYERTLSRKIKEIILACATSGTRQKEDTAMAYIFFGYYGWRMNGMLQAQNRHSKKLTEMDEVQLAELIARLKYPEPMKASPQILRRIEARARHLINLKNQKSLQPNTIVRNGTV